MLFGSEHDPSLGLRVWTDNWVLEFDPTSIPADWPLRIAQPEVERAIFCLLPLVGGRAGEHTHVPRVSWSLVTARLVHH